MVTLGDKNLLKTCSNFFCEKCDYTTSKKSSYIAHLATDKHKRVTNDDARGQKLAENLLENLKPNNVYICSCGKQYNHRQGLWRHKNKNNCVENLFDNENKTEINKDELIMMLIKQNSELIKEQTDIKQMILEQQNVVLEIAKNGTHNTTTTHTNSHNKAFNLNFFLNETCKDAMNIMDFVDSIKLQLSDLENVGKLGYVEGISNIIVKNLKELDVTKRPVHCTDKKREVLYIKDEDKWEKEDEDKKKMHKVIRKVACKNQRLIPKFKEEHPDCGKYNSKFSDQYNKIIVESMGGSGDNDFEKEEKIIQKISKEIIVEK
jgi:hypothetical protein